MKDQGAMSSGGDDRGVSRRDALKRGAIIGGTAFIIPVVGSISMSQASAQTPSGPPQNPGVGGSS